MTRSPLVSLGILAAALVGASTLRAQPPAADAPPAPPQDTAPAASAPRPARPISTAVAARLTALTPKYEPAPKPADTSPDLREIDKPRNTIIRLPSYLVAEDKPPTLKERDLRTPQGRLDVALKKHPGLRLGSFWMFRNDGIALAMLAEEERLERMQEVNDLLSLLPATDQKQLKPLVDQAFMRTSSSR